MRRVVALLTLIAALAAIAVPGASAQSTHGFSNASVACGWPIESTPTKANVAYPDSNATYWTTPYIATTGMSISMTGIFPVARFFSFNVYDASGQDFNVNGINSSLTDYEIVPTAGSQNPWVTPGATNGGSYTVTVQSNVTSDMTNAIPISPSLPATPLVKGLPTNTGFLMIRVYLPKNNDASTVPLPSITFTYTDGTAARTIKPCAQSQTSATGKSNVTSKLMKKAIKQILRGTASSGSSTAASTTGCSASLVFCKAGGSTTPFPNSDSGYVAARYQPAAGYVTVIKAVLPQSATTYGNGPGPWPATGINLRYWSFCNYVYAKPYPVVTVGPVMGCTADQSMPVSANNTAIVVISSPKDRPARTLGANAKLGWLPTSQSNKTAEEVIAIRNMLAAPGFANSVMNATNGSQSSTVATMGKYYPKGAQCTTATFKRGGVAGCFANPATPS